MLCVVSVLPHGNSAPRLRELTSFFSTLHKLHRSFLRSLLFEVCFDRKYTA